MKYAAWITILPLLMLASCATDKADQSSTVDSGSASYHLTDLTYDSSVFAAVLVCIRAGQMDAAMNRLELAQDAAILKLDELIPYADPPTQMKAIRQLQAVKAARAEHPRRPFIGSGQPYDAEITNIVKRAHNVLNRVED